MFLIIVLSRPIYMQRSHNAIVYRQNGNKTQQKQRAIISFESRLMV